jgi:hypothetical protein
MSSNEENEKHHDRGNEEGSTHEVNGTQQLAHQSSVPGQPGLTLHHGLHHQQQHHYLIQQPHSMPPHIMHHHHDITPDGSLLSNIRMIPQQASAVLHQMPLTSRMSVASLESVEGGSSDEDDEEIDDSGKRESAGVKPAAKIGKKKMGGTGRRRIDIKFIENKSRRQVTFSRRKRGLMKKVSLKPLFFTGP